MIYISFLLGVAIIFIIAWFRLWLYLFPENRLTILMYHSVQPTSENEMTVTATNLEKQLGFLEKKGYKSLFFKDLNQKKTKKSVIITFDDGYRDNKVYLLPLLNKHRFKATIFLPTSRVNSDADKMTFEELRHLDQKYIEFGLHSHNHHNYSELTLEEIKLDLEKNIETLKHENIPFSPVLAYPYGKYPKNSPEFLKILQNQGIKYALRIGNKINYIPFKKPYEVCRLDIKGSDTLQTFKRKLIFGKLKF